MNGIRYVGQVLLVSDVAQSRAFYEALLGQQVAQDYGRYVGFEGGFGIWDAEYAQAVIFKNGKKAACKDHGFELYFETEDLDETVRKLKDARVVFLHEIMAHEWGQRGFRIYDPDGFILEISEPIQYVIRRFFKQGLSEDEIAAKTDMPLSEIRSLR